MKPSPGQKRVWHSAKCGLGPLSEPLASKFGPSPNFMTLNFWGLFRVGIEASSIPNVHFLNLCCLWKEWTAHIQFFMRLGLVDGKVRESRLEESGSGRNV